MQQSYLESIVQEQQENQQQTTTQLSLLKVYHQMHTVNYAPIFHQPSINVFTAISKQKKLQQISYQPFTEEHVKKSKQRHENILKNHFVKSQNYISLQQFNKELKRRGISPKKPKSLKTPAQIQSQELQKSRERTISTNTSIDDMISQLSQYDERRSQIKYQIYAEDVESDKLYGKWQLVHSEMKQVLEAYLNKISSGKTLGEMYDEFNNKKYLKQKLEGHSKEELFTILDNYLQSLYLDERQLILMDQQKSQIPLKRKLKF